uniref:Uncharacterized protein n=1 Tax=Chenopodium quinoa TaxID=63459 RepID=A0A803MID9_CHEQI
MGAASRSSWVPPVASKVRINSDAVIFEVKGVGLGVVICDERGMVLMVKKLNREVVVVWQNPWLQEWEWRLLEEWVVNAWSLIHPSIDLAMVDQPLTGNLISNLFYDPNYDKDSCGVGFVAELSGECSRKTVIARKSTVWGIPSVIGLMQALAVLYVFL